MSWIRAALNNYGSVLTLTVLTMIVSLLFIGKLPIELSPNIVRPQLKIKTHWRAAAPQLVEDVIIEQQERVLQNLHGLEKLESRASQGLSSITLTFNPNTNMWAAAQDVSGRLSRITNLPNDVEAAVIAVSDGSEEALSWLYLQVDNQHRTPSFNLRRYVDQVIKIPLEKLPGVSSVAVYGGEDKQLEITVDLFKLASNNINLTSISQRIKENVDISGGNIEIGKRDYRLYFEGKLNAQEMGEILISRGNEPPIRLKSVATIKLAEPRATSIFIQNGKPAIALKVNKAPGLNALETLEQINQLMVTLNESTLSPLGMKLTNNDDLTRFIYSSLTMVSINIIIGILATLLVVHIFLRNRGATLAIAATIPISLIFTLFCLYLLDRSINVISLAGLALAMGMVVDAAIVVMESINENDKIKNIKDRIVESTHQVSGALLSSTITSIAIFTPLIFNTEVEGQLFTDLALTIAIAVVVSFFISVILLPVCYMQWHSYLTAGNQKRKSDFSFLNLIQSIITNPIKRKYWLVALFSSFALISFFAAPQLDYLPAVQKDMFKITYSYPEGTSLNSLKSELIQPTIDRLEKLRTQNSPKIDRYFAMFYPTFSIIGAIPPENVELEDLKQSLKEQVLIATPDIFGFISRSKLFGGFGWNKVITINLQAKDNETLAKATRDTRALINKEYPGSKVRELNSLENNIPQLTFKAKNHNLAIQGWTRSDLGVVIQALGDGYYVGDYFDGEKRVHTVLKSNSWTSPEEVIHFPAVSPINNHSTLSDLLTLERTLGVGEIYRVDGKRTAALNFYAPDGEALDDIVRNMRQIVFSEIQSNYQSDVFINFSGMADNLVQAKESMSKNLILALFVLVVVMYSFLRSVKNVALVLLTIPVASIGGLFMLFIVNTVAVVKLDMLSMVGFIIVFGLVVNNSILFIYKTSSLSKSQDIYSSILEAIKSRLRPILITTFTSIAGMLPLLVFPGEGSIIYRGLAAIVIGGLIFGLIFSLLILPCLLVFGRRSTDETKELMHGQAKLQLSPEGSLS